MQSCDLMISARWLAPVTGPARLIERGAIAISDGRIQAVGPADELVTKWQPRQRVERADAILIPGLINTHTHAAMSLLRGIADDLPLGRWLNERIWPLEGAHASADFVRDGARLAIAEMIRGGITCFNDMYFFPDIVAELATSARVRASLGLVVIEFPTVWAQDPDEYLRKGASVYDAFAGNSLLSFQFAPHSPYAVSEETLGRLRVQADQLDIGIHIHLHETRDEIAEHLAERSERPFEQLSRLGFVNDRLLAAHMVHVSDDEIAEAATAGVSVAHCPESNLKLASGIAPVARLLAAGVNVALGTDGAASNNDLDLLGEMRTAALVGKVAADDASALPVHTLLEMATINGARALGIETVTGSLEPGKWADVTCVQLGAVHNLPVYDPLSALVYSAGKRDVSDVWVAGRPVLEHGELTTIDEEAVRARTGEWADRIARQL